MKASSENRTHHAFSILLVLILHALLIFAFLRFIVSPQNSAFRVMPETHLLEMIINTARSPKPRMGKEAPASTLGTAQPKPQPFLPIEPLTSTVPTSAPDIRGLGQALSGCAPENFTNLDETQRSRCRNLGAFSAHDPSAVDYADHSDKVPGAKQWERELARKNAPLLLPCGNAKAFDPVYTAGCIIGNIANGFTFKKQYENQPGYFDKSGKPH
jgi:hypothetical protein